MSEESKLSQFLDKLTRIRKKMNTHIQLSSATVMKIV